MADYQAILYTPFGVKIEVMEFISLDLVRNVNGIGKLVLNLSSDYDSLLFTGNDVIVDNRIEVRRRVGAGGFYLEGETQWLVIDGRKSISEGGERLTTLVCEDAIGLLARRIVAYNSGSSQADKGPGVADNLMKDIVDENLSASATDTSRRLDSSLFTIQPDLSLGASVGKSFSRRNVFEVLREFADASEQAGTYLAFDIVAPTPDELQFRTYAGQRGVDRRWPGGSNPVLLSQELGNLSGAEIGYSHSDEINFAYAGGQGTGSGRNVQSASDSTRISQSPFNRREAFVDARMIPTGVASENAKLIDEADSAIRAGNIKRPFRARFTENESTLYGLNINFGDYVTIVFDGKNIDSRLNTIRLSVRNKEELIDARLQGEVE